MHISNERYFNERQRHDLALRMIRHEARTCTIRSCTGLTDDRIRRLYKTYASHMPSAPVRRRRGKSPRQVAFFVRNARAQLESSMLASVFAMFGLWRTQASQLGATRPHRSRRDRYDNRRRPPVLRRVRNAPPVTVQRRHLVRARVVSPATVDAQRASARSPLPTLRQPVPAGSRQHVSTRLSRVRAEANGRGTALIQSRAWRCRALVPTFWLDRMSNAPRTGARTKSVCARRSPIRRPGSCRSGRRAALSWLRRTDVTSAYFATGAQTLAGLDASGFILLGEFHEHVVFAVVLAGEAPPALGERRGAARPAADRGRAACRRGGLARLRASHGPLAGAQSLLRPLRLADDRRARRSRHAMRRVRAPAIPATGSGGHRAGHGWRARIARPSAGLAAGPVFDRRRLRRARGKPGGRGRARGPRGNGRDRRRGGVPLVAAVAVPVLADARLHRARQPDGHRPERSGAGGRPLVHPRADRSGRDRAADDTLDLVPPDRGLVRQRGEHAAAGGTGRTHVAAAEEGQAVKPSFSARSAFHSLPRALQSRPCACSSSPGNTTRAIG